jgi:hypothetical protein
MATNKRRPARTSRAALLGYARMTRAAWYRAGGFQEARCVRVTRGKRWVYLWKAL